MGVLCVCSEHRIGYTCATVMGTCTGATRESCARRTRTGRDLVTKSKLRCTQVKLQSHLLLEVSRKHHHSHTTQPSDAAGGT